MKKNLLKKLLASVTAGVMAVSVVGSLGLTASANSIPDRIWLFNYTRHGDTTAINNAFVSEIRAKEVTFNAYEDYTKNTTYRKRATVGSILDGYTAGSVTSSSLASALSGSIPQTVNGVNIVFAHGFGNMLQDDGAYTFNTQSNMTSAMSALKREEQRVLDLRTAVVRRDIQDARDALQRARVTAGANNTSTELGRQYAEVLNALDAIRTTSVMGLTLQDTHLFEGTSITSNQNTNRTYSVAALDITASSGGAQLKSVISNISQLSSTHSVQAGSEPNYLDITVGGSNDSWWYANSTRGDFNNTTLWFAGQMRRQPPNGLNSQWTHYSGAGGSGGGNNNDRPNNDRPSNNNTYDERDDLTPSSSNRVADTQSYFVSGWGWFPSVSAVRDVTGSSSYTRTGTSNWTPTNVWFDWRDGRYYSTAGSSDTRYRVNSAVSGHQGNVNVNNPSQPFWPQNPQPTPAPQPTQVNRTDSYVTINGVNYIGWSRIVTGLATAPGTTVNIVMQEQTSIPASVLAAAKTNNNTLVVTMANGARWTIAGSAVTTAQTSNLGITYNTKNIPTAAANRVTPQGTIARSQITIGDNTAFGFTTSVTVRYATSRAGRSVTLYRYDTARGQLVRVSQATIGTDGRTTFTGLTQGGDFLTVTA
ncbi:MAG: hypothetical protein FWG90_09115 [Oscillospiraceae bacterium]|nr:hypothetical protein [Oscillospiraceae bacterium]